MDLCPLGRNTQLLDPVPSLDGYRGISMVGWGGEMGEGENWGGGKRTIR